MCTFWKKHTAIWISLCSVGLAIIVLVIGIFGWVGYRVGYILSSDYNNKVNQVNEKLHQSYGNISYSIKNVDYKGPVMFPMDFDSHTFYLHDDTYDFDFTAKLTGQSSMYTDNYIACYCGKRVTDICIKDISVPTDCRISYFQSSLYFQGFLSTNKEYFQSLKNMSDDELVYALKESKNRPSSINNRYSKVEWKHSTIQLSVCIDGNEDRAKETAYQIYDYLTNLCENTMISELKINNRTVMKNKQFSEDDDSPIVNKEEFMKMME